MNLDKIKILSSGVLNSYEENQLTLSLNSKNKFSSEVLIAYRKDGFNLLEDIQSGRTLDQKIIVRNAKGEVLAQQTVDTQDVKAIEFLNQTINFDPKRIPAVGEYISIHIEVIYVSPFIDIGCEAENTLCNQVRKLLSTTNQNANGERSSLKIDSERSTILGKIKSINSNLSPQLAKEDGTEVILTPPLTVGDVQSISYREWKLISTPTYFKIIAMLKDGRPFEENKPEVFELPELPTSVESEKETNRFELEKEQKPLKPAPAKRRKKTIYLP